MSNKSYFVSLIEDVDKEDIKIVGQKAFTLSEIKSLQINTPKAFVVNAHSFYKFIKDNKLDIKIKHLLSTANLNNLRSLHQVSHHIKKLVADSFIPQDLIRDIIFSYKKIGEGNVNVFYSSLENVNIHRNFVSVTGDAVILDKIKTLWMHAFDERLILLRNEKNQSQANINVSIVVQEAPLFEKKGEMTTLDEKTNDKSKILIKAPELFEVNKNTLDIVRKTAGSKILNDSIIELATYAKKIEKHFYFPQNISWGFENNKIYIVNSKILNEIPSVNKKTSDKDILVSGTPVSPGISSGPAIIITNNNFDKVKEGEVVISEEITPSVISSLKKASAVVSENLSQTSEAGIILREYGIPAILGAKKLKENIKNGHIITVNGTKGEVYKGGFTTLSFKKPTENYLQTATKLYLNLSGKETVDELSEKNVDGVGLIRGEFIIAGFGIHPKLALKNNKEKEYTDKIAKSLETFCASFSPRPVIYRFSDFKSDQYRNLSGGSDFEPKEENPVIGFRGSYRHIHNKEVFEMEIEAVKKVRENYKNLWVMLPFVRTPKELSEIKKIINNNKLERSSTFKIWMMVETPSNVVLLDNFIKEGIDGISIGSSDLSMLMLGVDRDSVEVSSEFNELNPSVLWAVEEAIKKANKQGIPTSFCGEIASNSSEMIKNLVSWGIGSISVYPDALENTRRTIYQAEKEFLRRV